MKKLILTILFFLGLKNGLYNRWLLNYKKVQYDTFPLIRGRLFIRGQGQIIIGKNTTFISSAGANPIGGDVRVRLVTGSSGILSIGDETGISNSTFVCQERISIGKNVKIGGSVKIYDTDFHNINAELRKNFSTDIPITKPISIGDQCFIGAHSIILKGVSIGNRSIIGAGSVVTKSVPENEIWAGNPAKFIKKLNQI